MTSEPNLTQYGAKYDSLQKRNKFLRYTEGVDGGAGIASMEGNGRQRFYGAKVL